MESNSSLVMSASPPRFSKSMRRWQAVFSLLWVDQDRENTVAWHGKLMVEVLLDFCHRTCISLCCITAFSWEGCSLGFHGKASEGGNSAYCPYAVQIHVGVEITSFLVCRKSSGCHFNTLVLRVIIENKNSEKALAWGQKPLFYTLLCCIREMFSEL